MRDLLILALLFVSSSVAVRAEENAECSGCHAGGEMGAPKVDFKAFGASIHGKHLCVSCHADAAALPHNEKLEPVSCKNCHRIESQIYLASDHGRAVAKGQNEAAACKDCHGRGHALLNSRDPASPVNRKNLAKTCVRCHGDHERMDKFHLSVSDPMDSYSHTVHGEAFKKGVTDA
ncbi:MAG: hypothetical protein AAB412_04415, partial [Elusimicrobiota bacterium]